MMEKNYFASVASDVNKELVLIYCGRHLPHLLEAYVASGHGPKTENRENFYRYASKQTLKLYNEAPGKVDLKEKFLHPMEAEIIKIVAEGGCPNDELLMRVKTQRWSEDETSALYKRGLDDGPIYDD